MSKLNLSHFSSFMRYHTDIFNEFIELKNYDKLDEFIMLCEYINYFRDELTSVQDTKLIESYVIEIKNFANTFYDLCEQYGYSNDYVLVNEYVDVVLSL